jgi:hypothetical protein
MDDVSYLVLTEKLGNAVLQNKQLKRSNLNMKREIKQLRRVIKKMKDEVGKDGKPHYKNGRRGSKFRS